MYPIAGDPSMKSPVTLTWPEKGEETEMFWRSWVPVATAVVYGVVHSSDIGLVLGIGPTPLFLQGSSWQLQIRYRLLTMEIIALCQWETNYTGNETPMQVVTK